MFISFEKQFGDRDAIEDVIVGKRRFQCVMHTHIHTQQDANEHSRYEEELKSNSRNYDVWFDYARLEEAYGDVERVREVRHLAVCAVFVGCCLWCSLCCV